MDNNRVVITGLGVVSPNGIGLDSFLHAIKNGISGIRHQQLLADLKFSCQIAGLPEVTPELTAKYLTPLQPVSYTHLDVYKRQ